MKHILYLMHIPWGWIKQRPHFFAEKLAEDAVVDVKYKQPFKVTKKHLLTSNSETISNLFIDSFFMFPWHKLPILKYFTLEWSQSLSLRFSLKRKAKYDFIWLTSPALYPYIGAVNKGAKIIYDCMDDIAEFPSSKSSPVYCEQLVNWEIGLMKHADIVLCSSAYLKEKVISRSGIDRDIHVINNAISLPRIASFDSYPSKVQEAINLLKLPKCSLLYIGTISQWFDFKLICEALDKNKDVQLVLVGPKDCEIPSHKQLHYIGSVERQYIYSLMEQASALVMPFIVNELIRSVNPVKMYEYIYMEKPIIAPHYGEMEKFLPYVNLYHSNEEFMSLVTQLCEGELQITTEKGKEMKAFAEKNTWESRYEEVKKLLFKEYLI